MNNDFLIIVNPYSGNGNPLKILPVVKNIFDKNKINYYSIVSSNKNELSFLIEDGIKRGFKKILALGGDGTLNELLQYVVDQDESISMGILPAGSGNDMAKNLGFNPPFRESYVLDLINGSEKYIDIGICNNRYFCNE